MVAYILLSISFSNLDFAERDNMYTVQCNGFKLGRKLNNPRPQEYNVSSNPTTYPVLREMIVK